ncbi:NCOA1 protein, partial [Copsychus sechellarum]|nr:NCOA1 protein [Copsychus sechellarum]
SGRGAGYPGITAWAFPGMAQQSEAAFAPALSPGSPLVSPQLPPAPPAPGYQSPELKPWPGAAMGNNGAFPGAAAPAAAAGMYNNMSITVSMGGGGAGIGPGGGGVAVSPAMGGVGNACGEQVPDAALRPPGLYCNQLGSGELLKAEPDGAQVSPAPHTSRLLQGMAGF